MSSKTDGLAAGWKGLGERMIWRPKAGPLAGRARDIGDVYLVERGLVYVSFRATPAVEFLAYLAGPGDWIGVERALLGGGDNLEARAVVDSDLIRFSRTDWLERCERDAVFSAAVLRQGARHQQEVLRRMTSCMTEPIEDRLPGLLWDLCQPLPNEGGQIRLPFTQETLAKMAGCTRMTLHRGLASLANMGLLRLHRGVVEVPEPGRLGRYAWREAAPAQRPGPTGN